MKKVLIVVVLLFVTVLIGLYAKEKIDVNHSQHAMKHSAHVMHDKPMPKEFGEAGFAAIAEIVSQLSANPTTDWSTVNINGLREHLVLMNRLVTGAQVLDKAVPQGVQFNVTGSPAVLAAIQTMVPAHAVELDKMDEFKASTILSEDGTALTVTGNSATDAAKIKGLGFFGLMATGSHHQMHHFAMATGQGHH